MVKSTHSHTHTCILKMESRPSKQTNLKQLGKRRTATVELKFSLAR